MFATRRDQENVVHQQQVAKHEGGKAFAPKTPRPLGRTPFKKSSDENNLLTTKLDGKVKGAVAALEAKSSTLAFCTPAGPRLRAPLGTKTGNVKAAVFQTPANLLTAQRPLPKGTSPRLRKAKFQVHDGEVATTAVSEHREIEYMHPRETPLPELVDEDIWDQHRTYSQLEGENFTKGWAIEFGDADDESFDSKLRRFEESETKPQVKTRVPGRPEMITSVKAAAALSTVRGVGDFASATTASAARAVKRPPIDTRPTRASNPRHIVAKTVSNTTLGYSRGRRVSANGFSDSTEDMSPITPDDRRDILESMWKLLSDDDDDDVEDFSTQPIDILEIEKLRDLDLDSFPDD